MICVVRNASFFLLSPFDDGRSWTGQAATFVTTPTALTINQVLSPTCMFARAMHAFLFGRMVAAPATAVAGGAATSVLPLLCPLNPRISLFNVDIFFFFACVLLCFFRSRSSLLWGKTLSEHFFWDPDEEGEVFVPPQNGTAINPIKVCVCGWTPFITPSPPVGRSLHLY